MVERYVEACQPGNMRTKGIIHGLNVAIRAAPNASAKRLDLLQGGTHVEIVERTDDCLEINDEKGQWVRIRTLSGDPVHGWVFDAYLDYVDRFVD